MHYITVYLFSVDVEEEDNIPATKSLLSWMSHEQPKREPETWEEVDISVDIVLICITDCSPECALHDWQQWEQSNMK